MTPRQLLQILAARWKLVLTCVFLTVAITAIITLRSPEIYVAEASVLIDFEENVPYGDLNAQAQLANSYMITQLKIMESRRVARKVVEDLNLAEDPVFQDKYMEATGGKGSIQDWLADWLLRKLKVELSRTSRVVFIYFASSDPRFAADAANAFAQAYIDTKLELNIQPARQSVAWFKEQLDPLRRDVEATQARLTAYQQQNRIVATDERLDIETARLQALSSQLVKTQTETQEAENLEKQMKEMQDNHRSRETLPEISGNNYIQNIKGEMLRKEGELAELSDQLGENHPQYKRALAEVRSLRNKLYKEITVVSSGIENKAKLARESERAIEDSLAKQKIKVLELKRQRDDISVLVRGVENAQRSYDDVLMRANQASLESQINQTNVILFNEAIEPLRPSSPKVKQNLAVAVIAGMFLGLALALLFEMSDRRVRSEEDLAKILGLPVLGALGKA
jgi:chain length determinant protein EpsF